MCLIAISPKGTNKYSDFFLNGIRKSSLVNKDGFGFAFKKANTGTVFFSKGFIDIAALISALEGHKLKDEDELVVHLRLRSSSTVTATNTHPFELNYNSTDPVSVRFEGRTTTYPVMFHNGTLSNFIEIGSEYNDTYHFANKFMKIKSIWKMLRFNKEGFIATFGNIIGSNKLVFLSKEAEMITIGDFITKEGYIFSNSSYEGSRSYIPGYHSNVNPVVPHLKIVNRDGDFNSLNTNIIKIDKSNFKDFLIKSSCDIATGCRIKKDQYFEIKRYSANNSVMLEHSDEKGSYRFIDADIIDKCFIKIPKPETKKLYLDYIKMVSLIKATRSSVKKVFNKIISVTGRKSKTPTEVSIKYNNMNYTFDYKATLMFLSDYSHFIDKYKLEALLEIEETKVSNVCEC